jgi:uncharacterized protein YbaA (DUF1428 family)
MKLIAGSGRPFSPSTAEEGKTANLRRPTAFHRNKLPVGNAQSTKEHRMTYVDGFVAAAPTANREKLRMHGEDAAAVFKENGALKVAVKCKDDETVVFSWIVWPSRAVRDEGMKKVMADPRLQPDTKRYHLMASG